MKTFQCLICSIFIVVQLHAQNERSVFRKGYTRLGISTLGNTLDNNLSPKENFFKGNYGAGTGFVLESGHIYYFKPKTKGKINYGLDWTIFSATYNKLDKWNSYATAAGTTASISETNFSVSGASKLGPVISFNPVSKLVIDARLQVAAIARVTPFDYEDNYNRDIRSFAFYNYGEEALNADYNAAHWKNMVAFGVGTNVGLTVRYKAIGIAIDYSGVKAKTNYDAIEEKNKHSYGKQKIPTRSFQVKLSISL